MGGHRISLKEKIGKRGLKASDCDSGWEVWHENMRVRPAIASLQLASFCFGTLLALLMAYVGSRRA